MSEDQPFEAEFIDRLKHLFEEQISFNQLLGVRIDSLGPERVSGHITVRPELISHHLHQRLHGGESAPRWTRWAAWR